MSTRWSGWKILANGPTIRILEIEIHTMLQRALTMSKIFKYGGMARTKFSLKNEFIRREFNAINYFNSHPTLRVGFELPNDISGGVCSSRDFEISFLCHRRLQQFAACTRDWVFSVALLVWSRSFRMAICAARTSVGSRTSGTRSWGVWTSVGSKLA